MKNHENILQSRVKYPGNIHLDAQNLQPLIMIDLASRLGDLLHVGNDIKHQWFAEVTMVAYKR